MSQFLNNLTSPKWKMTLKRANELEWNCVSLKIPDVSVTPVVTKTPYGDIPNPGDNPDWGQLNIEYIVDEEVANYQKLLEWELALAGRPEAEAYRDLENNKDSFLDNGLTSDLAITLMSSSYNPLKTFTFHNAFPIFVGGFNLDQRVNDVSVITAGCAFAYTYFSIEKT